jgi:hypothetical protein
MNGTALVNKTTTIFNRELCPKSPLHELENNVIFSQNHVSVLSLQRMILLKSSPNKYQFLAEERHF